MEADTSTISAAPNPTYFGLTKTATYGFLSALPLIILYEVLIIFSNQGRAGQIRISSEVWLRQWTQYIDGPTLPILGGVLILIGIIIVILERNKKIKIKLSYFIGIVLESSFLCCHYRNSRFAGGHFHFYCDGKYGSRHTGRRPRSANKK